MTLKLRIKRIEDRLVSTGSGKNLQTICFLCDGDMPTEDQEAAVFADYKAKNPDWENEDLIEVRVNTRNTNENN